MKEEKFKLSTCIGGWYIDDYICDGLIDYYNSNIDKTHLNNRNGSEF